MRASSSERGVSVVVGAILVVGIVAVTFSYIYTVWGRHAAREAEAQHAEKVLDGFMVLKSEIHDLEPGESTTVALPMSPEPPTFPFPFLPSPTPSPGVSGIASTLLPENKENGRIVFTSNYRFYPNFSLVYEQGGVILVQGEYNSMIAPPAFVFAMDNKGDDNILVHIEEYRILKVWGGRAATGPVTMRIRNENTYYIEKGTLRESVVITMLSNYQNAWWEYFLVENQRLAERGYNPLVEKIGGGVRLTIQGKKTDIGTKDIILHWKVAELEVGVGLKPVEGG